MTSGHARPSDRAAAEDVSIAESPVTLAAPDGIRLAATLFAVPSEAAPPVAVLIVSGYGINARLYARFARFLAAGGIPALTFDCRGIAASRPPKLRGFDAVAEDWSELDCAAAIAYLRKRYPRSELVGVAHSFGSLILAGAPNVGEIPRFVFVGAHTGYVQDYLARFRLPMALLWHYAMPALVRLFGYFPGRSLHLGEDLPAGVARQWAARRSPDFQPESTAAEVERARDMMARFANVRGEALVIGFADDAFATEAGAQRFLSALPGLRPTVRRIAPEDVGLRRIGHFGFFRRDADAALWPIVADFVRPSS